MAGSRRRRNYRILDRISGFSSSGLTMQEHSGLLSSVRSLLASVADMAHLRLELLVNELEEDRIYLIKLLIYSLLMLFFFFIGVVVLTIMIVTMFDQNYRAIALGIFTIIYLGISAW